LHFPAEGEGWHWYTFLVRYDGNLVKP